MLDAGTARSADAAFECLRSIGVLKVASGQVDPHSQQLLLSCGVGRTVLFQHLPYWTTRADGCSGSIPRTRDQDRAPAGRLLQLVRSLTEPPRAVGGAL